MEWVRGVQCLSSPPGQSGTKPLQTAAALPSRDSSSSNVESFGAAAIKVACRWRAGCCGGLRGGDGPVQ